MEITKDKVTELFCIIDEFYKVFDAENAGKLLLSEDGVKRRRRKASLSDSEIMTILLYFHFGSFRNFKHYYLFFIRGTLKSYFPNAVSYNRFVELESRVFFPLMFFLNLRAFGRCNDRGEIIAFVLTGANVSDKDPTLSKIRNSLVFSNIAYFTGGFCLSNHPRYIDGCQASVSLI